MEISSQEREYPETKELPEMTPEQKETIARLQKKAESLAKDMSAFFNYKEAKISEVILAAMIVLQAGIEATNSPAGSSLCTFSKQIQEYLEVLGFEGSEEEKPC
jgi:lipid II:glycine glycyltransferase (peptidoglycan interpeptide bridge formation enzyme)